MQARRWASWIGLMTILGTASGLAGQETRITHGPMLGRLSHDGVGVWVRTSAPADFRVRYQVEDGTGAGAATGMTALAHDNTGWVQVTGLRPNTAYRYDVTVPASGRRADGGSFTTLPHPDQVRDARHNPRGLFNFSFEFACGNSQGRAPLQPDMPTFRTMLDRHHGDIAFQIMNGDWLYELRREFTRLEWQAQNNVADADLPRVLNIAPTIAGVWENYKAYLERSPNLRAWHRNVPAFFTFDDHEILNDVYGMGTPGHRDQRAVFRDIGLQAWRDYLGWSNPLPDAEPQGIQFGRATLTAGNDILEDPAADFTRLDLEKTGTLHIHWGTPTAGLPQGRGSAPDGHPAAGVYAIDEILGSHRLRISPAPTADGRDVAYSIGMLNHYRLRIANCDFFLLDTRTHRQMHDVTDPWKAGLSMLGERQKAWLMEGMRRSDADFFFVVSSVNFMVPHVGSGGGVIANKDDAWTVFLEEREQLIEFWDRLGKPVFVLTGDLHNSFAIRITDRVWEFASGPHHSTNHKLADEGGRPLNGTYDSLGRPCEIRWSSFALDDLRRDQLHFPHYCVVQVNNAFRNPAPDGAERWVAYPRPQVIFQYFDGLTGDLHYAESIVATER